jgi:hypothetical protein
MVQLLVQASLALARAMIGLAVRARRKPHSGGIF